MENNKQVLDEEKQQIAFRINMYIIQAMFLCLLDEVANKYQFIIPEINNEVFYKILNTNRTDYSKYKNGNKTKVTKSMTQLYNSCPKLKAAFEGKELIKVGDLTYGKAKAILDQTSTDILNICKEYSAQLVKNVVDSQGKELEQKFNEIESQICVWLSIQIVEWYKEHKSGADQIVRNYIESINRIEFEQLDGCNEFILKEFRKELKRVYKMTEGICIYKEEKKNHTRR